MFAIDSLRIENRRLDGGAPLFTDCKQPKISFSLQNDRRAAALRSAHYALNGWKREISDPLNCFYDGPELQPFTRYEITVTAEDDAGQVASRTESFYTGRLELPWEGQWISDPSYRVRSPKAPVPMLFRRRFTLDKPVKELLIAVTCMGIYELTLDGERVNDDYFAPGFTSYKHDLQYGCYLLRSLPAGEHEFTALIGGGWAVGRSTNVQNTNQSVSKLSADRQALLCELRFTYADGTTEVIGTDERYKVTEDSPWRFGDFYDGETYDTTVTPEKIQWRQAAPEKLKVHPRITARYGDKVLQHERLKPVSWSVAPSGELICDFGQNIAGVVELKVNGRAGQIITIRHAETLEEGELYVQNLRSAKQTLTYICREGEQTYSPCLTYMGFQYVGIRGAAREDIELTAIALYSDLEATGRFSCSNADLNKLQSNLIWSGKDNFVDIPTDCPQRDERQGWTGDIALFASTACFNFGMERFLGKWLLDLKNEQKLTGSIPFVIPERRGVTPAVTTSCWGDSCILVPWAVYLSGGDKRLLRRQYDSMKKYLADVGRFAAMSLPQYGSAYIFALPFQFGDWCAPYGNIPDWFKRGPWVGTAYYFNSCRLMVRIAEELGEAEDCAYYMALSEKIRAAFLRCLTDGKGLLTDDFQAGYVLALHFGLAPEEQRPVMARKLWELIKENNVCLNTGFTATPYILFALADNGFEKEAWQLLLQDKNPSWLYQIRKGATTTWEGWDILTEDGQIKEGSMNHYAYGSVGDFFYRRVCGLEATEGGYRSFRVKPIPGGGLTEAECEHTCPFGTIRVRWALTEGRFRLHLEVPMGSVCELNLPDGQSMILESGSYDEECVYEP